MTVARANAHVTYPARFQLVAAMNPCRCGHLMEPNRACGRAPRCGLDYQGKLSGPLLDRIDLCIDVPPVEVADLALPPPAEGSADVAARVAAARAVQRERLAEARPQGQAFGRRSRPAAGLLADRARGWSKPRCNADTDGALLAAIAEPDAEGRALLTRAAERLGLSARAWHRTLRVARTLADLDGSDAGAPPAYRRGVELSPPATAPGDGGVRTDLTAPRRRVPHATPMVRRVRDAAFPLAGSTSCHGDHPCI